MRGTSWTRVAAVLLVLAGTAVAGTASLQGVGQGDGQAVWRGDRQAFGRGDRQAFGRGDRQGGATGRRELPLFESLDTNRDGVLTPDELPSRVQRRMARLGRSVISREQVERFRERRRAELRQRRAEAAQDQGATDRTRAQGERLERRRAFHRRQTVRELWREHPEALRELRHRWLRELERQREARPSRQL